VDFKNPFASWHRVSLLSTSTQFPEGRHILTLITFSMRSLRRHRENHHCFLIPLTPITFDFNKLPCYGGSYYATIAVVSYQSKTSEFVRPSMPTSHRQFLQSSLTHFRARSPFRTVICHYQPPPRALQLSTSTYIISYSPTFWFHDTSMGHAHLVCTQILFFLPRERFGSHSFPSPSGGSLLQFLSSLFLTMALSAKETLMYFRLYVCS
jgi:hypothetical protein